LTDAAPRDDDELVLGLLDRDEAALRELQKRDAPYVLAALRRFPVSMRQEDIEEICQDTFLKVWQHIGSYDEKKSRLRTWIFRIAHNCAIDYCRSAGSRRSQEEATQDERFWQTRAAPAAAVDDPPVPDRAVTAVRAALATLSSDEREILLLDAHFHPGKPEMELLATQVGKPPGTIRVLRFRARRKIMKALKDAGYTLPDPEEADA